MGIRQRANLSTKTIKELGGLEGKGKYAKKKTYLLRPSRSYGTPGVQFMHQGLTYTLPLLTSAFGLLIVSSWLPYTLFLSGLGHSLCAAR